MSALPPKADMDQSGCDVRFVPKADILRCGRSVRMFSADNGYPLLPRGQRDDSNPRPGRVALLTVDTFDDPEVTLGRFPQNGECCLIRWTIVRSDCLSKALKFNYYGVLFDAVFIRLGRDTAGEEAPASSEHSWATELAVLLSCYGVGNQPIADHPICLGHCSPNVDYALAAHYGAHIMACAITCLTRQPMSALGQKRTLHGVRPMSALPPKADIDRARRDVRYLPKADILRCG